jgi:Mn-containing catalase
MDRGFHRFMYRFCPDDYRQLGEIWNGLQDDTGEEREVVDDIPEGGEVPDLEPAPPLYAPGVNAEDIEETAKKL